MDQNKDETFRVIDRRLFTPEGELREEALAEERREAKTAAAKPGKPVAAAPAAQDRPAPAQPPQRSLGFELLVDLVARNAVAYLGGLADPRTGQPLVDLEGAHEVIEMLDALREKTRGNLTADEEQTLLDVIGSLKMSYLEMSKAAAAAQAGGRGKAQGKV